MCSTELLIYQSFNAIRKTEKYVLTYYFYHIETFEFARWVLVTSVMHTGAFFSRKSKYGNIRVFV